MDNGSQIDCTPDHRILLANGEWIEAGKIKEGDDLMPFYRIKAQGKKVKSKQYPRVFTHTGGWLRERDFIDEWRTGERSSVKENLYKVVRCISSGMNCRQTTNHFKVAWQTLEERLNANGFTYSEVKKLSENPTKRRVLSIWEGEEQDVYDLSVDKHHNFCTDVGVMHNCQIGENDHMFNITCKNTDIKEELEWLFFHPSMISVDEQLWSWCRDLFLYGDLFMELVIDMEEPKLGVQKIQILPPESMYRIETIKGKIVEFQQSKEGPDYQSLTRVDVTKASEAELAQTTAIRFSPESIVHFTIGGNRKQFYPYGVSLIEAARVPAHNLRLMEDAMLVNRVTRAPERRVFYIDVGQLPPFKAEAFMGRLQDQFRKKKTFSSRGGLGGAAPVEERWTAMSAEEDFWVPLRPQSNTRIETLPGASNLSEIDDCLYFRNKLFISMCFPKNYMAQDDPAVTKVSLSSIDVKFSRLVERLQRGVTKGLMQIATRHLRLRGYPSVLYDDLQIKMTAPSHHRELSENEVKDARVNRLATLKGTMVLSDLDLLTDVMHYPLEEAKEKVARSMIQKLHELKLQVMSQNPQLLGIAMPQPDPNEMGMTPGGPNPEQIPGQETPPPEGGGEGMPGGEMEAEPGMEGGQGAMDTFGKPPAPPQGEPLAEPSEDEIRQYDLEIFDFGKYADEEEVDDQEIDTI